jgi:hypothetical protein
MKIKIITMFLLLSMFGCKSKHEIEMFQRGEAMNNIDSNFVNDKSNECHRSTYHPGVSILRHDRTIWHINEFVAYRCKDNLLITIDFPDYKVR